MIEEKNKKKQCCECDSQELLISHSLCSFQSPSLSYKQTYPIKAEAQNQQKIDQKY